MAIDVAKSVNDGGVKIDLGPSEGRAAHAAFVLGRGVLISVRTKAVLAVVIDGVRPTFERTHGSRLNGHGSDEKRHEQKTCNTEDPPPDLDFTKSVRQTVSLHDASMLPESLDCFPIRPSLQLPPGECIAMAEEERPRIGLKLSLIHI